MALRTAGIISLSEVINPNATTLVSQYLAIQLTKLHFKISKICALTYSSDILEKEIGNLKKNCDILLVIGNGSAIYSAISVICLKKLVQCQHLNSVYNLKNGFDKIAVPISSKIFQVQDHFNGINPITINIENIYVLPVDENSVKAIFESIILPILDINNRNLCYRKKIVVNSCQNKIQSVLQDISNKYGISLSLRCFCEVKNNSCELNILLSGTEFNSFVNYEKLLKGDMKKELKMNESVDDIFWKILEQFRDSKHVQESLNIIKKCYTDYNPEDVFLSFNGGKDCTVLLYLTLHVLKTLHPKYNTPLLCLYVQSQNPFPEVEEFIDQCKEFYNLEVIAISRSVKAGLAEILSKKNHLKACLMGTRRTDPYSEHLEYFQITDSDWPQVMRVSPILDWKYSDIWDFLLTSKVPYCRLYDLGFTSLGSKSNTELNPALKYKDELTGEDKYLPAYKLIDGSKERNGRVKL